MIHIDKQTDAAINELKSSIFNIIYLKSDRIQYKLMMEFPLRNRMDPVRLIKREMKA